MWNERKCVFSYEITSGDFTNLEIFVVNSSNYELFAYHGLYERYLEFSVESSGSYFFTVPETFDNKQIYYVVFYNNATAAEAVTVHVEFDLTTLSGDNPDDQGTLELIFLIILIAIGCLIAYGIYNKVTKNKGTSKREKKKLQKMVDDLEAKNREEPKLNENSAEESDKAQK